MPKSITYYEHYPHYMGTRNTVVKFTPKEFDTLISLSKAAIKEEKASGGAEDGPNVIAFDEYLEAVEKKKKVTTYALENALTNYYDSPRRPSSITNAIKKKGVWADQWEEGSHAFATTETKAKKAVMKIEMSIMEDEGEW